MPGDRNRAFNYAVVASLVLHAVLLFAFDATMEPERRATPLGPLIARLVEEPAPPAPPRPAPQAAPTPAKPAAAAKPAPRPKPAPARKPSPPLRSEPSAAPPPAPSAQAPEAVRPPVAAPASPVAPGAAPAGPVPGRPEPEPAPPEPQSAEAIDARSLDQYQLLIASAARKYKRYPRVALDNNWEGEVRVRMVVGANGKIAALVVQTSSGYDVLDQQALDMFRKAMPLVQIPAALRGREFAVEVRAIYNLKDQVSG